MHSLGKVAGFIPTDLLIKVTHQKLFAPFYHTVSNKFLPHIEHLYKVKNIVSFKNDLEFLLKHFKPVDYLEFLSISQKKKITSKPVFLLSFDDGLVEFHDVIAPILLKKGIPALCFLNSAFIDNKDLFFRYKVSLLINHLIKNPKQIQITTDFLKNNRNWKQSLLSIRYHEQQKLNEIAALFDFDFNSFLSINKPYLTSNQISSLIKQGFYFGSHSIDHPEYQYLTIENQLHQTIESTQTVANKFNLNYKTFSFPFTDFGVSKTFFAKLEKINITDSTFGCAGIKKEQVVNHFQRIPLEDNQLTGSELINREMLYYLLKQPLGKNTIIRND